MYYIFNQRGENIASCDFEPDKDDLASRGEVAVFYEQNFEGELRLQDGQIIVIAPSQAELLARAKAEKMAEINQKAQAFVSAAAELDKTPEFTQATWQEQANEAKAWHADNSTPTPTLDQIAISRGISPEILRERAYQKTVAFRYLTNTIEGKRQKYEDQLDAAETLEAVTSIQVFYSLEE